MVSMAWKQFLAVLCLVAMAKAGYRGHLLVSVSPVHKEHMMALTELLRTGEPFLDFWSMPNFNKSAVIRVPPESFNLFSLKMNQAGVPVTLVDSDVDSYLERSSRVALGPVERTSPFVSWTGGLYSHNQYRSYSTFQLYLDGFKNSFSTLVKEVGVLDGSTHEGRQISYITLGTGADNPVIFIEGLIHAREWIVGGTMLYTIDRLLSRYMNEPDSAYLLDNFDVVIVPVANPDGYEYSRQAGRRLWRKNRRPIQGSCYGVDLNRNFLADFGNAGVSTNCNSDIFCGPSAFSEAESDMIRKKVEEINANGQRLHTYLAVHSYSQLLLTPYSYAYTKPGNSQEIEQLAAMMNDALVEPFGTNYQWGHGPTTLYPVSGASDDWAMLEGGARYVFTYELRPLSSNPGFELPASHIIPNGYEFWNSLVVMAKNTNV